MTTKAKTKKEGGKLRIKVRAYEHRVLDGAVKQIIDTANRLNATVVGPEGRARTVRDACA